jgi:hypothetical protein
MSRSYKKNPVTGHTKAKSEKADKQRCSRSTRRVNAMLLKTQGLSYEPLTNVAINGHGSWLFAKDGKQYLSNDPKYVRYLRK